MLCAGLTTYSPLVRNGCGPGKKVGVVGIGGLGHFAILWYAEFCCVAIIWALIHTSRAKALGAEVYALTHSTHKDDDIKKLGADIIVSSLG